MLNQFGFTFQTNNKDNKVRIIKIAEENSSMDEYQCKRYPEIIFAVNAVKQNEKGNYRIRSINHKTGMMNVQYIDGVYNGSAQDLDMEGQGRYLHRKAVENLRTHGLVPAFSVDRDKIFSLGVLAANGYISLQTPEDEKNYVIKKYHSITGEDPTNHPGLDVVKNLKSKWHYQLRIKLHTNVNEEIAKQLDLGEKAKVHLTRSGSFEINSSDLVWHLITLGFRLGTDHDINKIKENVCQTLKDYENFEAGLRTGAKQAVANARRNLAKPV